jgi:hypothetical protein
LKFEISDLKSQTMKLRRILLLAWLLLGVAVSLRAQSEDIEYPTPVRQSEISGRITARDLGDARLTKHFYAFTGTPGDLQVRVESANLEGDVDIFLASGLRPVLKVSLFSGGGLSLVNKAAYLKRRETMILRIEARTPDDSPGTYKITFGGAFEPIAGPELTPEPIAGATDAKPKVRVNSAGARIEEPPAPQPAPTPVETIAEAAPLPKPAKPKPTPKPKAEPAPKPEKPATTAAKPKPAPTPRPARTKTPAPPKPEGEIAASAPEPAPPKPAKPKPTPKPKAPKPPATPPVETGEPSDTTAVAVAPKPAKPKPAPKPPKPKPPVIQTQLTLEMKDGTRVVREAVRRVTIDKGEIVVVTAEGKIERYSLLEVARMSVEPAVIDTP